MRGDGAGRALEGAFFLSGFSALVYETVWARRIALALGADAWGIAAVLAAFMGGFGLGSALAGRRAARAARPAASYALVEGGIGLAGLLSVFLLPLLSSLTPHLHPLTDRSPQAYHALRFGIAVAVLLPPATLLGATFPLMARLRAVPGREGEGLARLYASNTLGAAAGAAASAFLLVPNLGLAGSSALAAAGNFAAGATVFALLGRREGVPRAARPVPLAPPSRRLDRGERLVLAAAFLSGLASLAEETLFTRALVGVLGGSTYAFASVLTAFLLGIGLGPHLIPPGEEGGRARGRFALCQVGAAWGILLGTLAISEGLGVGDFLGVPRNRYPGVVRPGSLFAYQFAVCCAALLPGAIFLGAAFPAAIRAMVAPARGAARASALVYATNTAGAIAGTLLAAFVALPSLGLRGSLAAAGGVNLLAALLLLPNRPSSRRSTGALAAIAVVAGGFVLFRPASEPAGVRTLFHEAGTSATVSVEESTDRIGDRVRSLRVDGKVVATSAFLDMRLQRLLGVLPVLASSDRASTLTVGLGTGMTAGATALAAAAPDSFVVEIAPPVAHAAAFFDRESHGVLRRSRLRFEDGRNFLLGTRRRFGVITTDPIHPWTAGSGSLYTVEYFGLVRRRLAPGGAVAQWVPLYEVSEGDVRSILASFSRAFPEVALFLTGYDLVLLGRDRPISFDSVEVAEFFGRPAIAASLREIGIDSPAELLATFVAGDQAVRAYAEGAAVNEDERPRIEYSAPRSFLSGYTVEVLRWVLARRTRAEDLRMERAPQTFASDLASQLERRDRALATFLEAYGAAPYPACFPEALRRYVGALRKKA